MLLCRFYSTTTPLYNIKKQGSKLCKMLNPKSKRQWYTSPMSEANFLPTVKSLTNTKHEPGKRSLRRIGMLNKIFMKYITDLMSTGTVAMDIVGRGIEISKVSVTPDFNTVNVFWVCKGDSTDAETEAVLSRTAGPLRHELSTLRVMGEVPYIVFVKDKVEARIVDLDKRLAIADFGEDFAPTELGHLLKTEFTLDTKLSPEMKAKIKQLEDELPIADEPVPEMTHNVFGLDHAKIMNRLLASRKRSRDAWSSLNSNPNVISYRVTNDRVQETDTGQQNKELAEFLLQRKILQNKLHKQINNTTVSNLYTLDDEGHDSDEDVYDNDDDYYEAQDDYYESDEKSLTETNLKDSKNSPS